MEENRILETEDRLRPLQNFAQSQLKSRFLEETCNSHPTGTLLSYQGMDTGHFNDYFSLDFVFNRIVKPTLTTSSGREQTKSH